VTYDEFREQRYFPVLDGVRAISILLVFTAHIDRLFWENLHGSTGVTFFFVLSGFLITTLALREEEQTGRLHIGRFYLRRTFRIYPLYVVVLAAYCVLLFGIGLMADRREAFAHSLPYYLAFLPEQALLAPAHNEPPFAGAWSLGIEEKFYFVWPLLGFVLLARARSRFIAIAVVSVLAALAPIVGRIGHLIEPYALIALGCAIAIVLNSRRGYRLLAWLGDARVLAAVLVSVVLAQFTLPQIVLGGALYLPFGLLAGAALTGVLLTSGSAGRWLTTPTLVFLGRISYSFYLTHNFAINGTQLVLPDRGFWSGIVTPVVALPLAIALAWLLHVTVERPLIRVGHRIATVTANARTGGTR